MKIAVFKFKLFGINSYVVFDPETLCCAVIDPGMSSKDEEEAIAGFISRMELKPTHIINTHLHIDHAIGNEFLVNRYKIPVYASKADDFLGQRMAQQAVSFGIREEAVNVVVDRNLEDDDIIKIGNGELKVLAVPGHSPGSIALYDKSDGFVISGDALFEGSIGRTDLPGGNHAQLIGSINDKLLGLPDDTTVFPGHGDPTTIGLEKINNPFL